LPKVLLLVVIEGQQESDGTGVFVVEVAHGGSGLVELVGDVIGEDRRRRVGE
jgi:hypothetical protein